MRYKGLKNTSKTIALSLILLLIVISAGCFAFDINKNNYVIIGKRKILLEIADTPEKQEQGLMYINQLPENMGMIFLFDTAEPRSFWMKNMQIPLDIIFLRNHKIIKIYRNVQPDSSGRTYTSAFKSNCAIEVNAGFCDRYNVQVGDFVLFSTDVKSVWGKIKQSGSN